MKKIIIIVLMFTSGLLGQTRKLNLKESIELGLKNSKELRLSQSKLKAADAKLTEAGSQLLPQLRFAAGYTRLSDVPPFQVQIPGAPFPIKISDVILDNYNFRLSLQQPVFTGFRLSSLRTAADLNTKAAETDYSKDINEASFKIQSAFWQYYKARQLLYLLNENLLQNQKHLEDTKNNLQNGLVTQNDVLKLEVQLSNTSLQQIEAQNNLDIAKAAFNHALGLPLNTQTEIDVQAISNEESTAKLVSYKIEDIIKEAKDTRGELKSLQFRSEASRKAVSAARSGWYPLLFLNANYYYNNPNARYQPPVAQFKDTWDVGISLSWEIWNWGYTSSQSRQAEETALQTETSLAQLTEAVELEVYASYLTYHRAAEKITVSKQTIDQAKENYRIINDKYNVQLVTSTDLIDAETSVLQAETNYNTALVDFEIAKIRLDKSIGRRIY